MTSIGLHISPNRQRNANEQVAGQRLALADIAEIGRQSENEEQSGENIFAFGDPGHRFNTERMNGKDGRHDGAGPAAPRRLQQRQKEQHGNRRVDRGAGQMVPSGPELVELAIEHVRNPGQRMPVAGIAPVKARRIPASVNP